MLRRDEVPLDSSFYVKPSISIEIIPIKIYTDRWRME